MHDIGKLTIAPRILNKPGALDEHEWRLMKGHPMEGARIAEPILGWLGPWADAIVEHHERFDGKGYPNGRRRELDLARRTDRLGRGLLRHHDGGAVLQEADGRVGRAARARRLRGRTVRSGDRSGVPEHLAPEALWRTGPVSLVVQLPFLGRLQEVGLQSVTAMTQGVAAATVAAGVTAMVVAGPTGASAHGHHTRASAHGGTGTTGVTAPSPSGSEPGPGESSPAPGVPTPEPPAPSPGPGDPSDPSPAPEPTTPTPAPTEPGRPEPTPVPTPAPTTPRPSPTPTPRPLPTPLPLPLPLPSQSRSRSRACRRSRSPSLPPLPLPPLPRPSLPSLPIPRPLALLPLASLDTED